MIYDLERHAKLDQLTGRSQKSLNTGKIIFLFERPSCNVPFLGAASRKRNISFMLVNKKVTNTYRRSQDKDSSKDSDTLLSLYFAAFQGKVYLPVPAAEAIINVPQSLAINNNNDHEVSLRSDDPKVHKFSKRFFVLIKHLDAYSSSRSCKIIANLPLFGVRCLRGVAAFFLGSS